MDKVSDFVPRNSVNDTALKDYTDSDWRGHSLHWYLVLVIPAVS